MPKVVDHEARRRELAAAVGRVIARDGVAEVSIRSVAAESGWSSGALRHYFATRGELLAFACEQVIDQVTERITGMDTPDGVREAVLAVLLETMPVDERRHAEATIAFSFLALGLGDPALAAVQKRHFAQMYDLCRQLAPHLTPDGDVEATARCLHAVVDGLTVHVLAGHLDADEMVRRLGNYLDEVMA
ncbi:TetR family transcriptional regulator C-terminal domain-containing protein [Actinoplanes sp. LDG1-06]|uniref:TetR family transcriptional regulator C-terminal domain-containing protein n=1 Tax=Paractinoplanes ovalisporus TaxID=2810368 RepID=A0ABS2AGH3_9ACTN|nr:TetR family transcriptional regulator C-terminal domain-containing protein [Actinoplanes ovalisporus]MBM2618930.1 TetR family transcriptional regulator C-terminal domain-containing protein [Actinoplanes ovalisporus]